MDGLKVRSGSEDFDIDAREAQVIGDGQRIAPMHPEEFTEEAMQLGNSVRSLFGITDLSDVPDIFATMFKHPGLYRCQMQLGVTLNKNGALPPRDRELAILRVAWLSRSPLEWGEHVRVGKLCGLTPEEIERVRQGSDADGWSDRDRALVRAVEELIGAFAISDATWDALSRCYDEQQLIEVPGLVGAYVFTAMLYNTLRFEPFAASRGLREA